MKIDKIPIENLFNPHRAYLVKSGSMAKLFYYRVPKGTVLFITGITVQYYLGLRYIVEIDGEKLIYERQVGEISFPYRYEPPIVVQHYIKIIVENLSNKDLYAEILLDGFLVDKSSID